MLRLKGFEISKLEDLLENVQDTTYFSVLDLKDACYHIPMRKENRVKILCTLAESTSGYICRLVFWVVQFQELRL